MGTFDVGLPPTENDQHGKRDQDARHPSDPRKTSDGGVGGFAVIEEMGHNVPTGTHPNDTGDQFVKINVAVQRQPGRKTPGPRLVATIVDFS